MNLAAALQNIGTFFCGNHGIAVEIGGPLFELGKIFHRLQRPLGAEDALNINAP